MERNMINESNKCLTCKNNARCSQGCPVSTAIPQVVELYRQGKLDEAGRVLFENNPLSLICSMVCPHENNCVGNCILGIKGEPIDFPAIEREISLKYLKEGAFEQEKNQDGRVAIIGSGPSGITLAFILARRGYRVTIFEKHSKLGGVLRYGIPEFRLPKEILDTMEGRLLDLGVKIRYNDLIGPVNNVEKILEDGYNAVFIGTGVWNPKPMGVKGETLGHVHYAINYLKSPESFRLGRRVAVIGAGNVAMDAARTAKRKGAEDVFILYRRGLEDMKATKVEIREAREDGVKFALNTAPVEVVDRGIVVSETMTVVDDGGKEKLIVVDGSESLFHCDSVVVAVSQSPADNIVSNTEENIEVDSWGLVLTDDAGHTTRRGVFASGDVVTGARTVVEAVANTKKVAAAIEEYLRS
ncbi:oxidoreductase [Propionigenium maris DSM 9537]|uniref:Oxidoreductase n=1 Tax=Propionigenium maris DSM 9537 TaxID=1123000 RepID=A0A9W6GL85_9FUSO|nr:NAD(P)-dependent oxidoreductase [Propionigenium maris]GLI56287.1 oxidoreductase [Propionigenium maris DSM 9537]